MHSSPGVSSQPRYIPDNKQLVMDSIKQAGKSQFLIINMLQTVLPEHKNELQKMLCWLVQH